MNTSESSSQSHNPFIQAFMCSVEFFNPFFGDSSEIIKSCQIMRRSQLAKMLIFSPLTSACDVTHEFGFAIGERVFRCAYDIVIIFLKSR